MNKPASHRTRWILVLVVVALAFGLALMRALDKRREAAAAASAPTATSAAALELLPGDLVQALPRELVATVAVSGGLQAVDSAIVKAKVAGELRTLSVREGDAVKAGQLIGRVDATEYEWRLRQAEDQAAASKAQLDIAERTLANNRALVEQGFISRNALDTAVNNAAAARASLQAAHAAAELARKAVRDAELRAPLSGLISQRFVQPGERVNVDGRIVEIVDLSRLELQAAVPAEEIAALRVGQRARLAVDGLVTPVAARVVRINPATQGGTRAVLAYLAVEPAAGLRQGLFAQGSVHTGSRTVLAVPQSTLRTDRSRPQVLVAEDGQVRARSVGLGTRGEADFGAGPEPAVEVTEGLSEGAIVLRASVGNLPDGTRLQLPPQVQAQVQANAAETAAAAGAAAAAAGLAVMASAPRP